MDYLIRLLPATNSSNFDVFKKAALGQFEFEGSVVG